eukprot:707544-Alexandrium_andersonii.AAC.1
MVVRQVGGGLARPVSARTLPQHMSQSGLPSTHPALRLDFEELTKHFRVPQSSALDLQQHSLVLRAELAPERAGGLEIDICDRAKSFPSLSHETRRSINGRMTDGLVNDLSGAVKQ